MKSFLSHPVMGLYAAMLLGVIVGTIGLEMTGHRPAAECLSLFGTLAVVFGFALYAVWHAATHK